MTVLLKIIFLGYLTLRFTLSIIKNQKSKQIVLEEVNKPLRQSPNCQLLNLKRKKKQKFQTQGFLFKIIVKF